MIVRIFAFSSVSRFSTAESSKKLVLTSCSCARVLERSLISFSLVGLWNLFPSTSNTACQVCLLHPLSEQCKTIEPSVIVAGCHDRMEQSYCQGIQRIPLSSPSPSLSPSFLSTFQPPSLSTFLPLSLSTYVLSPSLFLTPSSLLPLHLPLRLPLHLPGNMCVSSDILIG